MRLRPTAAPILPTAALLLAASLPLAASLLLPPPAPALATVTLPPAAGNPVHDLAGVLSPTARSSLQRLHTALFDTTGVALVVVTVASLEGEPIEDFALRAGTEWGVGRKGEDRGVVVALAIAERRIFVATGYGVEGFLPDGRVGGLIDRVARPALGAGDYDGALLQLSAAIAGAAAGEYGVAIEEIAAARGAGGGAPRGRPPGPAAFLFGLAVLIFLIVLFVRHPTLFLMLLFSGMGRGGYGGGRRGGFGGGGFGGGTGFGGFGGGGFGGGGAGRGF